MKTGDRRQKGAAVLTAPQISGAKTPGGSFKLGTRNPELERLYF